MPIHRNIPNPAPKLHADVHCGSDFEKALQDAIDNDQVLQLNGPLVLDQPVIVRINGSNQGWFGLDGNMARITSNVVGEPVFKVYMDDATPAGTCARGMFFGNFSLRCNGDEGGGLQFVVPFNDRWIVNPLWRDIWIEGAGGFAGLSVEGSIFEGNLYAVGTMNCKGHGAYFNHAGPQGNKGVVSALRWWGGTHRQNGGDGILVDQYDGPSDVRLYGLYFCENAGAGINTLAGLELVDGCGFENNGAGHAIYAENFAHFRRCTGSTWGPQPTLVRGYVVSQFILDDCSLWNYGDGDSILANLNGNNVIVHNCDDVIVQGDAKYIYK